MQTRDTEDFCLIAEVSAAQGQGEADLGELGDGRSPVLAMGSTALFGIDLVEHQRFEWVGDSPTGVCLARSGVNITGPAHMSIIA